MTQPIERASEALQAFVVRDYTKAQSLLQGLSSSTKDGDIKVAHNSLLTRYCSGGCSDQATFLTDLRALHATLEKKPKKRAQTDDDDDDDALAGDDDHSLARYNRALLCYQTEGASD